MSFSSKSHYRIQVFGGLTVPAPAYNSAVWQNGGFRTYPGLQIPDRLWSGATISQKEISCNFSITFFINSATGLTEHGIPPLRQAAGVIGKCYQLFSPRDYRPDQLQYILSPAIVTPVGNWYRILRNQTDGLCHSLENFITGSQFLAD